MYNSNLFKKYGRKKNTTLHPEKIDKSSFDTKKNAERNQMEMNKITNRIKQNSC